MYKLETKYSIQVFIKCVNAEKQRENQTNIAHTQTMCIHRYVANL